MALSRQNYLKRLTSESVEAHCSLVVSRCLQSLDEWMLPLKQLLTHFDEQRIQFFLGVSKKSLVSLVQGQVINPHFSRRTSR